MKPQSNDALINENIPYETVLVIDDNGAALGKMPTEEANRIAKEKDLDLVVVSPNANPPVCKIMNYGKYRFEQNKKAKEHKKNQKVINTKEIQVSITIDKHDLDIKIKNARKFLMAGDKVYVAMRLRGRENVMVERGIAIVNSVFEQCKDVGTLPKPATHQGNTISLTIMPLN